MKSIKQRRKVYELLRGAGAHRISLNETPRRNCSSDLRVYRVAEAALDNGHDNGDDNGEGQGYGKLAIITQSSAEQS